MELIEGTNGANSGQASVGGGGYEHSKYSQVGLVVSGAPEVVRCYDYRPLRAENQPQS